MQLHIEPCYMDPFIKYLDQRKLPEDKNKAKKIASKVGNYLYEDGVLFKKGKSMPWLQCVGLEEASIIVIEFHQGICDTYKVANTMANKIFK